MADLVNNILKWFLNQAYSKLFKIVKKQLKDPKTDKNHLQQAVFQNGISTIAPIHAAAVSNSPELFNHVLETKDDPDTVSLFNGKPFGGVLEVAVNGGNIDIISMVLEKIEMKSCSGFDYCGEMLPKFLFPAVKCDHHDIVELLLSFSYVYPELTTSACLVAAIGLNKWKILTHFLAKSLECTNELIGKHVLLHIVVINNRVEMSRELMEAGCDVNIKEIDGYTPSMLAVIAGYGKCVNGCYDQIISELVSPESIDLDVTVKIGTKDIRALELLTEGTCHHVRNIEEQAYARKKQKSEPNAATSANEGGSKSDKFEYESKMKVCWSCELDAEHVSFFLCRGCMETSAMRMTDQFMVPGVNGKEARGRKSRRLRKRNRRGH